MVFPAIIVSTSIPNADVGLVVRKGIEAQIDLYRLLIGDFHIGSLSSTSILGS
jgi:hypothetical protein